MRRTFGGSSSLLVATAVGIAAAVFFLDTITEHGIALAVLYVTVVLIAVRALSRRAVLLVSALRAIAVLLPLRREHGSVSQPLTPMIVVNDNRCLGCARPRQGKSRPLSR